MWFVYQLKKAAQLLPCYLLAMALGAEANIPFLNLPFLYCSPYSENNIRRKSRGQISLASSRLNNHIPQDNPRIRVI